MEIHPPTLRHVEVHFRREMQLDIRPNIQPLLDAGLELRTEYSRSHVVNFSPWQGLPDQLPTQNI